MMKPELNINKDNKAFSLELELPEKTKFCQWIVKNGKLIMIKESEG